MKGTTVLVAAALLTASIGLPVMAGAGITPHSFAGAVATTSAKHPQGNAKSPNGSHPGCKPGAKGGPKAPPTSQPGCCR